MVALCHFWSSTNNNTEKLSKKVLQSVQILYEMYLRKRAKNCFKMALSGVRGLFFSFFIVSDWVKNKPYKSIEIYRYIICNNIFLFDLISLGKTWPGFRFIHLCFQSSFTYNSFNHKNIKTPTGMTFS